MRKKSLTKRFETVKPWLLKDDWAAMTYMLIPSVLEEAAALERDLLTAPGKESKATRQRLLAELRHILTEREKRVAAKRRGLSLHKS